MDFVMSHRRILVIAVALGFVSGFAWVAATTGGMAPADVYASAD